MKILTTQMYIKTEDVLFACKRILVHISVPGFRLENYKSANTNLLAITLNSINF